MTTKPPKSPQDSEETARFSAANIPDGWPNDSPPDDFDLLEDFDPDCDASCWDPGEIELDEPDFDPRDFCLEDADD